MGRKMNHFNRPNVNRAKVNRANINRTNVNRTNFDSANFQRNVTVNRKVSVSSENYGPHWGGVAAGVVVGAGVTAVAPLPPTPPAIRTIPTANTVLTGFGTFRPREALGAMSLVRAR